VTSHILPELARICSTVAIITCGRLRAFGQLDEVMRQLCPRRSYEVQLLEPNQLPQAQATLSGWLQSDEPLHVSQTERVLRFPTARSERELAELLQRLVGQQIEVAQFREVATDLEDAFLTVAGPKVGSKAASS
jgi:ABC-2 type transport system ATP-binding protein